MPKSERLEIGNTVELRGGYSFGPKWLSGAEHVKGSVIGFIPGQNDTPAAVVKTYEALVYDEVSGDILVLELRYIDAVWSDTGIVHIELCDFTPEPKPWQERRRGKWAESHATYKRQTD